MQHTFLPFALPDLDETEWHEVRDTLASGWLTTGPKVQQFEKQFAAYVGATHAVAVNSCTAAMHLALEAAGVEPGDFVLTTPYTFAATAEVVLYLRAIPVFVDVEPKTLNIDPQRLTDVVEELDRPLFAARKSRTPAIRRAVAAAVKLGNGARGFARGNGTHRLRAIIPVHLAGQPCELDTICRLAAGHSLAVIEDCAHALPASYKGRTIGGSAKKDLASACCFSFYATKTLTTGEGGMVTTDNDEWAEHVRIMSLHGISKDAWKRYSSEGSWYYEIIAPGFKYNMTDIAAALGLAQLKKAQKMWQRRQEIAARYKAAFQNDPALEIPAVVPGRQHAWHLYMLRLNLDQLSIDRDQFILELKRRNIGASVHFIPLHLHPYYRKTFGYRPEDFPIAYQEYKREISLPIYSRMTERDVRNVIATVGTIVRQYRRRSMYAVAGY